MKKIISVTLSLILVLSMMCIAPFANAEEGDRINFALATDLHIDVIRDTLEMNYPESELYFHADGSGNLYDEATGIANSFLSQAAQQNVDFILLSGDLTRDGDEAQHRYVAELLKKYTEETGIRVYVVPGNHDYHNSLPADFKEYYKDVCYADALVIDDVTASYTADLPNNFRLIAVDSNKAPVDGDGLTERTFNWIREQVKQAKADGKEILYTMHHPVLEHLYLGRYLMKDFMVRNHEEVAEMFCDSGIQYVFTGHEHGNDIAKYESKSGKVLYDVLTTSLSSYPLEYRLVSYGADGVDIKMQRITECDFSSLVNGYNDAQLELMKNDYTEYSYGYFKYAIEKKILKYTSPDFIKDKLGVQSGPLAAASDTLMTLVNEALEMPLYKTDDGSQSIEALAEKKGVTLPESDYGSLLELATTLVAMHYHGDENMSVYDTIEAELLVKGLNTGLEYILSGVEKEVVVLLAKVSESYVGAEGDALEKWFIAAANGDVDSYKIAEEVLYPFLENYTYDKAPADRDVSLPAFGETVEAGSTMSVLLKFIQTIIKLVKFILKMVSTFTGADIKVPDFLDKI